MKQFVKALDNNNASYKYLFKKFPRLSDAKFKEGVFDGPQIRSLMADEKLDATMNNTESEAWLAFKDVVNNILGNNKHPDYKNKVANLLDKYRKLGCNMSIKLHFLDLHLDFFLDNLGDYSEEQGKGSTRT